MFNIKGLRVYSSSEAIEKDNSFFMNPSPPTDSPSPPGPSNTRKRQRSHSMQSESSESSLKRTTTTPISIPDDIDRYMAAQDAAPVIGPAEKITLIESLAKEKMETGQTWYLVSMEWWRRWHKACTGKVDKDGGVSEAELGPVDNKPLIDDYGNLKELVEGIHVKYVPAAAWQHLVSWSVSSLRACAVLTAVQVWPARHASSPKHHCPRPPEICRS